MGGGVGCTSPRSESDMDTQYIIEPHDNHGITLFNLIGPKKNEQRNRKAPINNDVYRKLMNFNPCLQYNDLTIHVVVTFIH